MRAVSRKGQVFVMGFSVGKGIVAVAVAAGLALSVAAPASAAYAPPTKSECDTAFTESVQLARGLFDEDRREITAGYLDAKRVVLGEAEARRGEVKAEYAAAKAEYRAVYDAFKANPTADGAEVLEAARQVLIQAREGYTASMREINAWKKEEVAVNVEIRLTFLAEAKAEFKDRVAEAREVRMLCKRGDS